MKGKDEVEGTRSNFTPWLCDFEHQGENRSGGLVQPPLGELELKGSSFKSRGAAIANDLSPQLREVACFRNEAYALVNIVRGVQINKKEQYYLYIYIQPWEA